MYSVFFKYYYAEGHDNYSPYLAGTFVTLNEARSCAQQCHGYILLNGRVIEDYGA